MRDKIIFLCFFSMIHILPEMWKKYWIFILVVLCLVPFAFMSCSFGRMKAKWKENPIDGPWAAPGVQVREKERSYFAGLMDAVQTTDTVWEANGHRYNAYQFVDTMIQAFMKQGYFDRWPKSQANYDGYDMRVAPFTFHIVAIKPLVVVLVPHDFGLLTNCSINDIVGDWPKQSFHTQYMLNHIEYGTRLPYHPEILWFSPDLDIAPTRFTTVSESEQAIVHNQIKLVVQKQGYFWISKREL
jgi:hypothetical protein